MGILLPPTQYDHPPSIPVIERVLPANEAAVICRTNERLNMTATWAAAGCAIVKNGICYVVRVDMPDVARHELAHCNGWPSNHPGGYYEFNK